MESVTKFPFSSLKLKSTIFGPSSSGEITTDPNAESYAQFKVSCQGIVLSVNSFFSPVFKFL
jgi:hypothetical protein